MACGSHSTPQQGYTLSMRGSPTAGLDTAVSPLPASPLLVSPVGLVHPCSLSLSHRPLQTASGESASLNEIDLQAQQ